jgi:hypothetical protein
VSLRHVMPCRVSRGKGIDMITEDPQPFEIESNSWEFRQQLVKPICPETHLASFATTWEPLIIRTGCTETSVPRLPGAATNSARCSLRYVRQYRWVLNCGAL